MRFLGPEKSQRRQLIIQVLLLYCALMELLFLLPFFVRQGLKLQIPFRQIVASQLQVRPQAFCFRLQSLF